LLGVWEAAPPRSRAVVTRNFWTWSLKLEYPPSPAGRQPRVHPHRAGRRHIAGQGICMPRPLSLACRRPAGFSSRAGPAAALAVRSPAAAPAQAPLFEPHARATRLPMCPHSPEPFCLLSTLTQRLQTRNPSIPPGVGPGSRIHRGGGLPPPRPHCHAGRAVACSSAAVRLGPKRHSVARGAAGTEGVAAGGGDSSLYIQGLWGLGFGSRVFGDRKAFWWCGWDGCGCWMAAACFRRLLHVQLRHRSGSTAATRPAPVRPRPFAARATASTPCAQPRLPGDP
jgi:hypothetical protein